MKTLASLVVVFALAAGTSATAAPTAAPAKTAPVGGVTTATATAPVPKFTNEQILQRARAMEDYSRKLNRWREKAMAQFLQDLGKQLQRLQDTSTKTKAAQEKIALLQGQFDLVKKYLDAFTAVNNSVEHGDDKALKASYPKLAEIKLAYRKLLGEDFPAFNPPPPKRPGA